MTTWQWQAMLIEHNRLMKRAAGASEPMSDEAFDAAKERIRRMNLPDVKI